MDDDFGTSLETELFRPTRTWPEVAGLALRALVMVVMIVSFSWCVVQIQRSGTERVKAQTPAASN